MADFTTISKNLNKLFVRVPASAGDVLETIVSSSSTAENAKKIYFVENQNTIVVNGIKYGLDPGTAEDITKLQQLIGATDLSDASTMGLNLIDRIERFEALDVSTNYLTIGNTSAGAGAGTTPTIGVKIVSLDNPGTAGTQGLVDAANAKTYIDNAETHATTTVEVGKGLSITDASTNGGPHKYTVAPNLELKYTAASGGEGAKITLESVDAEDPSVFGTIQLSQLIGNGVLKDSSYDKSTGILSLYFANATADGSTKIDVNLAEMLDINDMLVTNDSSVYLNIDLSDGENSQAQFSTKMQDPSTAAANKTGLADAYLVKQYVDSKSSDLAVKGLGDDYISLVVDEADNKQLDASAKLAVVSTVNTTTTYSVADDGTITTTAGSHTLSVDTSNRLLSAGQAVETIKQYVDANLAEANAYTGAKVESAIKSLDSYKQSETTKNVVVDASIVDGKLVYVGVAEKYATVTGTRADHTDPNDTDASLVVTDPGQLVTGSDISTLVDYINDRLEEETGDLAVEGLGDSYISVAVDDANNKQLDVSANIGNLTFTEGTDADSTLTGVQGKLVDSAQAGTAVSSFVNTRITEEINKLDTSVTFADTSSYISIKINEVDGKVSATDTSVGVVYGDLHPGAETATDPGIATTQNVQAFVDQYNFWETYSAS